MELATWILVIFLSVALLIFLIAGIVLAVKMINLTEEARKIVTTGQKIATKADDIVDNVKGMTTVGGIVRNFSQRVMENQERRYAAEDEARAAVAEEEAKVAAENAKAAASEAKKAAKPKA